MTDTVVLEGQQKLTCMADGDLEIIIETAGGCEIESIIDGRAELVQIIDGDALLDSVIDGEAGSIIETGGRSDQPVYTGPTEVTPSTQRQRLNTAMMSMTSDIIVHPIPNNYGLITWNGSALTVS